MSSSSSDTGRERRVGVFTTDTSLVIKSWDTQLANMTAISAERAVGQRLDVLVPDLTTRIAATLLREPLVSGAVQVLAPAFHKYLIPCPPSEPSTEFDHMQQRVVIGALHNDDGAVGLMVTIEDVTVRLERERQLARDLHDGSPAERLTAVRELATLDNPDGLGPIEAALSDDDWHVRRTAVRAVANSHQAALVDTVVEALRRGHRNFSLLSSALELLSTTGVDITDALISLMKHPDPDLRIQAALALGTQSRDEAIHALVAAFDDPDVNVRFHAIEAIGRRAYAEAANRLADIATSGDFFLAFPAIEALVRINDPLVAPRLATLLESGMLAAIAADALGRIGDEASIAPLVHALDEPNVGVGPVVDALAHIHQRYSTLFRGAAVIETLVGEAISKSGTDRIVHELSRASGEALRHVVTVLSWIRNDDAVAAPLAGQLGQAEVRHEVIEALVRFGGPAVTLLLAELAADDVETRRAAIVALGRLGDTRATPALTRLLLDEDERELWVTIAAALARLGDRCAFDALLVRLGDPDVAVRQAAIGALNSIGHPSMSSRIAAMIDDRSPLVRESAIRIAGYFGYSDCADRIFARCQDEDESVSAAALEHLPYFDDDRTAEILRSELIAGTPRARRAAAQALGSMPGEAERGLLERALDDPEPWVRYFAAISLGRQGNMSSLRPLAVHAQTEQAVQVSVAAIEAMASIGGDDAIRVLADLALDEGERGQTALRALGAVKSPRGIEILRDALRSADPCRRRIVVEALAADGTSPAVEVLRWTAAGDADSLVSRDAIAALRDISNRKTTSSPLAVRALVDALRDSGRRDDTLSALADLDASAIPVLAEALNTADAQIRRVIVEALGRLSHPAASAQLRVALSDEDPVVRRTAITALARIGTRDLHGRLAAIAQSDPSPAVRQAAAAVLCRGGSATSMGTE